MSTLNVNRINDASGGVLAPISSVMRNRIINGAMTISQRNGTSAITIDNNLLYTVDRWSVEDSTDGVLSAQQVTDAPAGFYNSLKVTVTTADSSLGATQWAKLLQPIEANNVTDLDFGLSTAKTITVSFWVKSSLTGTFGASILNSAENRCFPFSYVINSANTWEYKTATIAGDTTGTWARGTNLLGLRLVFGLGVGSTYSGTAGAWTSSSFIYSVTGSVNLINTLNATIQFTGVQLEVGTQATGFEYRQYGTELALCQRYFSKSFATETVPVNGLATPFRTICAGYSSNDAWSTYTPYVVTMRTTPTMTIYSGDTGATAGQPATFDGGSWVSTTSFTINTGYNNGFGLTLFRSGGFTNQSTRLIMFNYTASAEL